MFTAQVLRCCLTRKFSLGSVANDIVTQAYILCHCSTISDLAAPHLHYAGGSSPNDERYLRPPTFQDQLRGSDPYFNRQPSSSRLPTIEQLREVADGR